MNWKVWLHGLGGAAIGGAATAITNMVVAPETFNLQGGLKKLGMSALVSAIFGAALYLKQSPLPSDQTSNQNEKNP